MRAAGLEPAIRIQLDADPDLAESFLGAEPDFTPHDAHVWDHYWRVRNATVSDAAIDLERALSLHARLHGEADERRLVDKLQAMDVAFLTGRGEQMKRKSKERGK